MTNLLFQLETLFFLSLRPLRRGRGGESAGAGGPRHRGGGAGVVAGEGDDRASIDAGVRDSGEGVVGGQVGMCNRL